MILSHTDNITISLYTGSWCRGRIETQPASRRGSHVYEINNWKWNFGRSQPRVGGLSVAKTERICRQARSETSWRAWETRKASKLQVAADSEEIWRVYTCSIPCIYHCWIKHAFSLSAQGNFFKEQQTCTNLSFFSHFGIAFLQVKKNFELKSQPE